MSIQAGNQEPDFAWAVNDAVNGANLSRSRPTIHTINGPNGAAHQPVPPPDRERPPPEHHFDGKNLMRNRPIGRVGPGMARSFQLTSLFQNPCAKICALAAQGRDGARALNWRRVGKRNI